MYVHDAECDDVEIRGMFMNCMANGNVESVKRCKYMRYVYT